MTLVKLTRASYTTKGFYFVAVSTNSFITIGIRISMLPLLFNILSRNVKRKKESIKIQSIRTKYGKGGLRVEN
jgi:membrane protein insertase Oxa1/YidC/SpoIIIJ